MKKSIKLDEYEQDSFDKFSRKLTPPTKHAYYLKILLFKEFLFTKDKEKDLFFANRQECDEFMTMVKEGYAKSTSEKIYSYLHSFYNFLLKEGAIEINPFRFVEKPTVTRNKNKDDVLSIQEINQLIDLLHKINLRDRAIIVFLITTGCLLNELVSLKWKDFMIDMDNNSYVRLGKAKKERVIKLHPYCFKLIENYRNYSGLSEVIIPSEDFVFITQKSNSITDRNVRIIVRKALDMAGLNQYSARDFRHSFAAIALRLGADEEDIKKQLGWSDKYYAIRYKYVLNFVDSESVDYLIDKDNLKLNEL